MKKNRHDTTGGIFATILLSIAVFMGACGGVIAFKATSISEDEKELNEMVAYHGSDTIVFAEDNK